MFARAAQLVAFVAVAGVYLAGAVPFIRADTCARSYTVVEGDTCDAISAAQNVSTYQLATVNAGVIDAACDNLWVGQVICLGFEGHDCNVTRVVVSGDTCSGILNEAGITLATLRANNPNVDAGCTNIYPDEVLCTAKTVIA